MEDVATITATVMKRDTIDWIEVHTKIRSLNLDDLEI